MSGRFFPIVDLTKGDSANASRNNSALVTFSQAGCVLVRNVHNLQPIPSHTGIKHWQLQYPSVCSAHDDDNTFSHVRQPVALVTLSKAGGDFMQNVTISNRYQLSPVRTLGNYSIPVRTSKWTCSSSTSGKVQLVTRTRDALNDQRETARRAPVPSTRRISWCHSSI